MTMTDEEIIQMMRELFEGLFPKVCTHCGRNYETLREYIRDTNRLGQSVSYDAEMGYWDRAELIGGVALANCCCGNTLALTTQGMPVSKLHMLLKWMKIESEQRGLSPSELLDYVRDEVRKRVSVDSDY